jgi:hypothetical protein
MKLPSMLTTGGMKGYILNHFDEHCIDVTCGDSTLPDGVIQSNPDHKTFMIRNTKGAQLGWPMSETPQFVIKFKEGRREAYFMFELHFKTKSVYEAFKNGATEKPLIRYMSPTEGPWMCKTIAYDDERLVIWTQATGPSMSIICFTDELPSDVQTIIFWFYDRTIYDLFSVDYLPNPHGLRLKPISVGDTLGLVYWDGTHMTYGMNIRCSKLNDTRTFHLGTVDGANPDPTNDDRVWLRSNGGIQHFTESPAKPQTFNLSSWNLTVMELQQIDNPLAFGNHLWHVI